MTLLGPQKLLGVLVCAAVAGCGDPMASSTGGAAARDDELRAGRPGAVFVLTNEAGGNAVLAFARAADGTLTPAGQFPTGGAGTGGGLGSQGALALSADGRWLYAVDAGSDELSLFRVHGSVLEHVARVPTGGDMPVSVSVHGDLAFVVHAGGNGGIAGFVRDGAALTPAAGSARPLSASGAAPAQVSFSPDGAFLVVTEKATNLLSLYEVEADGSAQGPSSFPSAGQTPFGFEFARKDMIIVSEAFGGRAGESALSSYLLDDGTITQIDPVVGDGQTAACWVVITRDRRHAFTTNTGSDNISIYTVDHDGDLAVAAPPASTGPGSAPTDAALTRDARFLYVLDSGTGEISAFAVAADGTLTTLAGVSGLPASTVGIAAL